MSGSPGATATIASPVGVLNQPASYDTLLVAKEGQYAGTFPRPRINLVSTTGSSRLTLAGAAALSHTKAWRSLWGNRLLTSPRLVPRSRRVRLPTNPAAGPGPTSCAARSTWMCSPVLAVAAACA